MQLSEKYAIFEANEENNWKLSDAFSRMQSQEKREIKKGGKLTTFSQHYFWIASFLAMTRSDDKYTTP